MPEGLPSPEFVNSALSQRERALLNPSLLQHFNFSTIHPFNITTPFTPYHSRFTRRKSAFTLAEVLITLGIIGVVAAMTLPALVASHRKTEVETRLKKFYSVMNQAINMTNAEYGEPKYWWKDCGASGSPTCSQDEAIEWFQTYIGKHLQILNIEKATSVSGKEGFLVYFKDGSILRMNTYLYDSVLYINKRALTSMQSGINAFAFRFNPVLSTGQKEEENIYTQKSTFEPYTTTWDGTREDLFNNSNYGCAIKDKGGFCAKLIQYDGWEIKDDYPLKF